MILIVVIRPILQFCLLLSNFFKVIKNRTVATANVAFLVVAIAMAMTMVMAIAITKLYFQVLPRLHFFNILLIFDLKRYLVYLPGPSTDLLLFG